MISDHLRVAHFTSQSGRRRATVRKRFEGGRAVVSGAGQRHMRGIVKRVDIRTIRPNFASERVCMETLACGAGPVTALIQWSIVRIRSLGVSDVVCLIGMELTRSANVSNSRASTWTGTASCLGIGHVRHQLHCARTCAADASERRLLMVTNITSGAVALIRKNTPSASCQKPER